MTNHLLSHEVWFIFNPGLRTHSPQLKKGDYNMTERISNDKARQIEKDEQYVIPYDDVNGSSMSSMLANMMLFNKMAKDLHNDNIDDFMKLFEQLNARYKVFLYKWLRQNWDSLSKEKQEFAKPYYRTGRMIL